MFTSQVLELLRCPVTRSPLIVAQSDIIDRLNLAIDSKTLVDRVGNLVTEKIDSGLVNADGSLLLPVRGGIAVLIADQAIDLTAQPRSKNS